MLLKLTLPTLIIEARLTLILHNSLNVNNILVKY